MGTKKTQKLVIGPTVGITMDSLLVHKINPVAGILFSIIF